jgi:hypothetical protein
MKIMRRPRWPEWNTSPPRLQAGVDDALAHVTGRFRPREVRPRTRACLQGPLTGLAYGPDLSLRAAARNHRTAPDTTGSRKPGHQPTAAQARA